MKQSMTFVATAAAIVVGGALATWPFLTQGARRAVLGAGILTLGAQLPTHFLLRGWRRRNDRFLAAIAAGFAARVLVLVLAVVFLVVPGRTEPLPFLLSLGAFLLTLVFAESFIEHRRARSGSAPAGTVRG